MKKRHIFIASIIAIALGVFLSGCGRQEESAQVVEQAGQGETARKTGVVSAKIVDPVCGMRIEPGTDITAEHEGETYHFCSTQCRDRFLEEPGRYMSEDHMSEAHGHMEEGEEHHIEEESHEGHGH